MRALSLGSYGVLALVVAAALAGGVWLYREQEAQMHARVARELAGIASLKAREIAAWRERRLDEGRELVERPLLARRLAAWIVDPRPGTVAQELLAEFRVLSERDDCEDVALTDAGGRILLALSGRSELSAEPARIVDVALRSRDTILGELYIEAPGSPARLCVAVPVSQAAEGEPLGTVVLTSDARRLLYPLVASWPVPSQTAESYLARREGSGALVLSSLRHIEGAELALQIPLAVRGGLDATTAAGAEGVLEGRDYRGMPVVAAVRQVPDSPWLLVAKVDAAEAFAPWHLVSALLAALPGALAAVAVTAALLVWQGERRLHALMLYRAEAARRASERRYGAVLHSIEDAVIVADAAGRIELVNGAAEALTGWPDEEAAGRPLGEVFRIETDAGGTAAEDPAARVLHEGAVVNLGDPTVLIARDGTRIPIGASSAPIRDEAGEIVGIVLVFRDQTEDRRARRELADALALAEGVIATVREPLLVLDRELQVLMANRAFCDTFGVNPADVEHQPFCTLPGGRWEDAQLLERLGAVLAARGSLEGYELVQDFPHVGRRTLVVDACPLYAEGERGRMILVGIQDVTEQRRVEAEREKLHAQLQQAQKMEPVGRLAGGMAHDFNNTLQTITGNIELALRALGTSGSVRQHLEDAQRAAHHSADLIRQLLAFARRQTVSPRVLDLNEVVASSARMLQRLIGEDIQLALRPGAGVRNVRMDPVQLDQILANLCVNARDAISGAGTILIETANVTLAEAAASEEAGIAAGDYVMLAVSDDGCGMSREVLEHLFEPFYTTKPAGTGTGLGLATVYGIVRQNRGFTRVYSEPGKGSTFKLYLPSTTEAASERERPRPQAALPQGRGETILLVEDDPMILAVGRAMLEGLGYGVLSAATPTEALGLAGAHAGEIHLLITDVVMPEMNGRELAEKIRALRPTLKCLFMSGYTSNVIAHRGVLDPGLAFVQKPFSMADLAVRVAETLAGG